MSSPLPVLIDSLDTFELVRDRIGELVAINAAQQVVLATAAAKPVPADWGLRVYLENKTAWDTWTDAQSFKADPTPVVNVWFEASVFDYGESQLIDRQKARATYNIDIVAGGITRDDPADPTGKQIPASVEATTRLHRASRYVRNYMMAAQNIGLQFARAPGESFLIQDRRIESVRAFEVDATPAALIVLGSRLQLSVEFDETSQQIPTPDLLEEIHIDVLRESDGFLFVDMIIDTT